MTAHPVLGDAAALLDRLNDDRCRPGEALARLTELRAVHPGSRVDLVWQEEPADGSFHYDVLLRDPGGRTLSLSAAPAAALPWPLRGAARAGERDLLRVNEITLQVDRAFVCLDGIWDQPELLRRLVDICLIEEALAEAPIVLTRAERQAAMDAFRRAKGLLAADATRAWMAERSLSHEAFEQLAADHAILARLRGRVVGGRVEAWFAEHHDELATATVAWCEWHTEDSAAPLPDASAMLERIARAHREGRAGGIERIVLRELPERLDGPVRIAGHAPAAAVVVAVHPARLDAPTRRVIETRIWDEWLAARRRPARVEWLWGDTGRTAAI